MTMCESKRINFNDEIRIDDGDMDLGGDFQFDDVEAADPVSNSV